MPLHIRVGNLAAKDLDRHENRRERMAYLVDHFAGIAAGWECAESRVGVVEFWHDGDGWGAKVPFARPKCKEFDYRISGRSTAAKRGAFQRFPGGGRSTHRL